MKKTFRLLNMMLLLFLFSCDNNADQEAHHQTDMREMAKDSAFRAAHEEPEDTALAAGGENIELEVPGGKKANVFFIKSPQPTQKYLLIFHEWWGLNNHIKNESIRYAHDLGNVNVLALDLFDGSVAATREQAAAQVEKSEDERIHKIIESALKFAGKEAEIGTLGWCFGGGWSLEAAIQAGPQVKACVLYYGTPVTDPAELKKISAPVLGIFGRKDDHITPEMVNAFEQQMKKLNKTVTIQYYNAVHAFANPSNPKFDAQATKDSRKLTISFLQQHLMSTPGSTP